MISKISAFALLPALALFALPLSTFAAGPYVSSNLGYDLSYNAPSLPATTFNFGVIGVTRGKALVRNDRLVQQYSWARVASNALPTLYMNLNAPYGSTVAGHINTPNVCPLNTASSTEPTMCQGYDYGYNAAQDALAYTKAAGIASSLWWLDIEEANSWSPDVAVNDATIQGAIDYFNAQGIRVGIYSMQSMWNSIAGSGFVPTQAIGGMAVSVPNWLPIGTATQIEAGNACVTETGFIPGSPLWLIQYEANSTAVDQNIAC